MISAPAPRHKRMYGVYKACGLNLRTKRPRRSRSAEHRLERLDTQGINKVWSGPPRGMDFVQDALFNGERFRVLTVVDNCTGPPGGKICLGLLAGKSLKGADVVAELSRICLVENCFPERIQCDNGSERPAAAVYLQRDGFMGIFESSNLGLL